MDKALEGKEPRQRLTPAHRKTDPRESTGRQAMIHLLGSTEGREAEAARDLRGLILESWPNVAKDERVTIHIIAGVKCHGQKRRDLDLVLLVAFEDRVRFSPFLEITWGEGGAFRPKEA